MELVVVLRDLTFTGLERTGSVLVLGVFVVFVFVFVFFEGDDGGDENGLVVAFKGLCFFGDGVDGAFVAIGSISL